MKTISLFIEKVFFMCFGALPGIRGDTAAAYELKEYLMLLIKKLRQQ